MNRSITSLGSRLLLRPVGIATLAALSGLLWLAMVDLLFFSCTCRPPKNPRMVMKSVEQAIVAYQTDNLDACPKRLDDLYTERYLTKLPRDPWGEPLLFRCPGDHNPDGADLVSKGKDRLEGTADDIRSWER